MSKLDTGPYKGVRDFYPEDQFIQNHITGIWKKTLESFGYQEYAASILEPSELYRAKTGEEIVSEQTYHFQDRGEREVTLRPEMTPTVARMIAAKRRELTLPVRWYSIPNLFRYESPQKGRLREHWQLNADIFGIDSIAADTEIVEIAHKIMLNFGASEDDFLIRLNSRRIVTRLFNLFDLSDTDTQKISKLIDKKAKISEAEFNSAVEKILGENSEKFIDLINSPDKIIEKLGRESLEVKEVLTLSENLSKIGINNVTFDLNLMRGFDYYTGIVFEIFDTNPENKRSLFGGGRYDELLDIFDEDRMPAVGFGAGDVTIRDFLESRDLLPTFTSKIDIAILPLGSEQFLEAQILADKFRSAEKKVACDWTARKVGDMIKAADKHGAKYVLVLGPEEVESGTYKLKKLETGDELVGSIDSLLLDLNK